MEGSRIEEFCSRVHIECMALGGFTEFRRQAVSPTVFRDQTGTFASQCFGERLFRLTVFRGEIITDEIISSIIGASALGRQEWDERREFVEHYSYYDMTMKSSFEDRDIVGVYSLLHRRFHLFNPCFLALRWGMTRSSFGFCSSLDFWSSSSIFFSSWFFQWRILASLVTTVGYAPTPEDCGLR